MKRALHKKTKLAIKTGKHSNLCSIPLNLDSGRVKSVMDADKRAVWRETSEMFACCWINLKTRAECSTQRRKHNKRKPWFRSVWAEGFVWIRLRPRCLKAARGDSQCLFVLFTQVDVFEVTAQVLFVYHQSGCFGISNRIRELFKSLQVKKHRRLFTQLSY